MNENEKKIRDMMTAPPRPLGEHPEVQRAQSICQHAASILSDIIKSGRCEFGRESVASAFAMAGFFDEQVQQYMNVAVERAKSTSQIITAPPSMRV